jgi:uncharacterized protein YjbI with pentapeptide repeats
MANQEHLDIFEQGVEVWNQWRKEHVDISPDLSRVVLSGANLRGIDLGKANLGGTDLNYANLDYSNLSYADLSYANLDGVDLSRATLIKANLEGANLWQATLMEAKLNGAKLNSATLDYSILRGADLTGADLGGIDLSGADLSRANLSDANLNYSTLRRVDLSGVDLSRATLIEADLSGANLGGAKLSSVILSSANLRSANLSFADLHRANLHGADLSKAILIETNFTEAILTDCRIYGIAAWDVKLQGTMQLNLIVTQLDQPTITVDNLEIAQFIYLLLNNPKIRDVIDTIAKKAVLILGRFTPERKAVLDALRVALRTHGYVPILFDFEKPSSRDVTETVSILAHLARFIIADLTEPSSLPKELEAIVPMLAVPVQPLLEGSTRPYAMFKDYWKYQWVLEVYRYNGLEELLTSLKEHVIEPAERKANELAKLRAQEFEKQ